MSFRKLVYLFFLILPVPAHQQQHADYRYDYQLANKYYETENPTTETDSLALLYFERTARSVAQNHVLMTIWLDCQVKAGNIFQGQQQYNKAIPYYHRAHQKAKAVNDSLFLYQACLYMGSARYSLYEIDSAHFYFEKASRLAQNKTGYPDLPILYNSLGILYYEAANFEQAINYFQLAADRLQSSDPSYTESLVSFQNNIAGCYARLGRHEQALSAYQSLLKYNLLSESLYQNIGHAFYNTKQLDSSLFYFSKVAPSLTTAYARLLADKARIYMHQGQLAASEQMFDSTIALHKQLPGHGKNKDKAYSYLYRSQLAEKQGLLQEAIGWCNIALSELHYSFHPQTITDLPAGETEVISPIVFFETLRQKADLLMTLYQSKKESKWLEAALRTNLMAVKTANYIRTNFDNDEAAFFFNENFRILFEQSAIQATFLHQSTGESRYVDSFLLITESYKGSVLNKQLQLTRMKSSGNVPDSLLRKEKEFKQLLAAYTTRLNNSTSEENALQIRKRITSLQIELSRLHKQYEVLPGYTALQNPSATLLTRLSDVQSKLDDKTAVLQYFWCDTVLLCLAVHQQKVQLLPLRLDSAFLERTQQLIRAMYEAKEGIRFGGTAAAANLYKVLTGQLPSSFFQKKQWIILPDGLLNFIPFESLLVSESERTFLVLERTLSYHYSFTLLLSNAQESNTNGTSLVMAPFSKQKSEINGEVFSALPYSARETAPLKTRPLEDTAATKSYFLQNATSYSLLHLATHAFAYPDSSGKPETYIQFFPVQGTATENNRLYLHEIYALRFTKQPLVVLSACETAGGQSSASDGILSLSRAFLYAGSSGIISSLWKANDQVTAYLMEHMYTYVEKGWHPGAALQKAKVDFLNDDTIDERLKAPSYWAPFIYVGPAPSKYENSSSLLLIALLATGVTLSGIIICRFKRRKASVS
jgi:CHAT domain-containing protein